MLETFFHVIDRKAAAQKEMAFIKRMFFKSEKYKLNVKKGKLQQRQNKRSHIPLKTKKLYLLIWFFLEL